jgi:hypothetical protein
MNTFRCLTVEQPGGHADRNSDIKITIAGKRKTGLRLQPVSLMIECH